MPVHNRIKIIPVSSLEEVENKVNDFLAFDEHIAELVHIDYRLESNFVIIEYYVVNGGEEERDNRDSNNKLGWGDYSYDCTFMNPWLKLWPPYTIS
jgi:hypothetical protein